MSASTILPSNKFHECSVCGTMFQFLKHLRMHCHQNHPDRPHVCGQCRRAFGTPSDLETHQRDHARERPHLAHTAGRHSLRRVT
ncbi:hypothetical protein CDAR_110531 [Caerostris darwini]|uniref:C2H2-type domain-containing protein n=1 Tax=Caerostris darwini TaxID=1538125 RepID=A0AAV4VS87_9ARAC|nr:hypothetical protein CDAR_110531 [Caerostris darwini]